ncbi:sporulation protein YqfD [Paraliobacillus salinarum]|uniref:sporulation protein YqfD n=1 Tax=Paraliobacillus salinarum TaxID=1158996 RepID=UPI0015F7468E|nr:sporulation protein YqfD [Paraliobacillus salinarum]
MNHIQATWLQGYVQLKIEGYRPELFFDLCARNQVHVWKIKKINETTCTGHMFIKDLKQMKKLRKQTRYKVYFVKKKGLPFLFKQTTSNRPFILGLIASFFFVLLLSNMVWSIDVQGVRPEIEKQIRTTLNENGVYKGKLKFTIRSVTDMQQLLLDEIPELLWVGVKEKGTTYALEGVEKTQVSETEESSPRHIVAKKNGVITDMYVSKGRPIVSVNDYVKKGDILVAGTLKEEQEEESEDKKSKNIYVAAQAEIYANTWYESTVSTPTEADYHVLTGDNKNKYYVTIGNVSFPVWGFFQKDYEDQQIEMEKRPLHFFQWTLPIHIIKMNIHERDHIKEKRTKEEAKQIGIEQAKKNLQLQLGRDSKIIKEKILHETAGNDKVKLRLYFTVKENIAKTQDLSQGD